MSGQATINIINDEEMNSQGNVNAPVAPPPVAMLQSPAAQVPAEMMKPPFGWNPGATQWSEIVGPSGTPSLTVPA